jgi:type VI secretion system protein ImpL
MKDTFMKFLKIFLLVAAAFLIILIVVGAVLVLNWPWWVGIFLVLGLIGLGIGCLFLRNILLRRREQQFVQNVIEQDESAARNLAEKEKNAQKELQDRWKEAVEALRKSHLRKQGNPLYVLPWYLVMGESGSGKTTAITSARLSSPFAQMQRSSGLSGTKNCDWWFLEQAVILDTAGRYTLPVNEGKDSDEWQRFLTLLVKYRRREPINGLIMTVAANKLLETSPEVLEEEGKLIRGRIDELMRALGVKFPIYIMVTKCDLIQGMTHFCESLPEKSLDQAIGVINQSLSSDTPAFLDNTFNTLGERLRNIRLLLLHQPRAKSGDPGFLLFPEEFDNLRKGLSSFTKVPFLENPYQETPVLRGIFFSSGRQEGTPYSHFLNALGVISDKEVLPGTNKGLFLHDFFATILPRDKSLIAPTKRAVQWSALTRNIGLTAWVVLCIAACGILSFSFVKNLGAVRGIPREFVKPVVLRHDILADLITADRFRQTILSIEKANRNWWIPKFGLYESVNAEMTLKNRYCALFQNDFLTPFDKQMEKTISGFAATTNESIDQYIMHLVRRINLLKARLDGQTIEAIEKKPQPYYVSRLSAGDQEIESEARKKFGYLYLYYLVWKSDAGDVNREIGVLRAWLDHLLKLKGSNLQWLITWVDNQGGIPPVTLGDFWTAGSAAQGDRMVGPAFTRKGKQLIDSIIEEMESAVVDPLILATPKASFQSSYRNASFDAWQGFGSAFPKGAERLKGPKDWQQMATKMATDQGPYFALLNKITSELEPLAVGGNLPAWLQQVYNYQAFKSLKQQGQGIMDKAMQEGKKLAGSLEKTVGKSAVGDALESQAAASKAFQEYKGALDSIATTATSRNQSFQLAYQVFNEDSATSKSPFFAGYGSIAKMKAAASSGRPSDDALWRLLTGPMDFYWTYVRAEAACMVQNQWEEKVLSETQGEVEQRAIQVLMAQDGPVWKFVKGQGTAAPFIGWSVQKNYYAKEVFGGALSFDPSFFTFLTKGVKARMVSSGKQQGYTVTIKGLPTDTNPEAKLKPQSTKLELQCTGGTQALANYHFPVTKNFNWTPDGCDEVRFQIDVGDIILTKTYSGPQSFLDFLQDFKGGRRTFSPDEFQAQKAALERLGIKYIRANYQFSGEQGALAQRTALPSQIPKEIVRCWDR